MSSSDGWKFYHKETFTHIPLGTLHDLCYVHWAHTEQTNSLMIHRLFPSQTSSSFWATNEWLMIGPPMAAHTNELSSWALVCRYYAKKKVCRRYGGTNSCQDKTPKNLTGTEVAEPFMEHGNYTNMQYIRFKQYVLVARAQVLPEGPVRKNCLSKHQISVVF